MSVLVRGPIQAVALENLVRDLSLSSPSPTGWILVLVASVAAMIPVQRLWNWIDQRFSIRAIASAEEMVALAALRPAGIRHLEDPDYSDTLQIAQERAASVVLLNNWLVAMAAQGFAAALSAYLLARVHPLLLLPLAIAAGLAPLHGSVRRNALAVIDRTIPGQRLAQHLFHMGRQVGVLREVQLMSLTQWLTATHRAQRLSVIRAMKRAEIRPVIAGSVAGALQALALGCGLAFVVVLASRDALGPGQVAAAAVLLASALAQVSELGSAGSDVARNGHAARHLARLAQFTDPDFDAKPTQAHLPEILRGTEGIRLEDVSFAYSWASDRWALRGVTLHLPPGSVVALVGENGAGKSTLVKLLLALYQPTAGTIRVAGTDLRHLDPSEWRGRATGAFQDFARFRFLARESIGVGRLEAINDLAEVRRSAELAGIAPAIEQLPLQFENQLGKMFHGGAELSAG